MNPYLKSLIVKLRNGSESEGKGRRYTANNRHDYERFAEYLIENGLRTRTVKEYLKFLNKFESEITPESLENYRRHIRFAKEDENARKRINYFMFLVLKQYLRSIGKKELVQYLPEKVGQQAGDIHPEKQIKTEDFNKILVHADEQLAMLARVLYHSGLRISEGLTLRKRWIDFDSKPAQIIIPAKRAKSRKKGFAYLPSDIAGMLKDYIDKQNIGEDDCIFSFLANKDGRHYRKKNYFILDRERLIVISLLRNSAKKANLLKYIPLAKAEVKEGLSSHWFRHCFFHNLRVRGFSLEERQLLGRHSDPEHTQRYDSPMDEEIKEKFNKVFG